MSKRKSPLSPEEQEQALLDSADELFEKSAAVASDADVAQFVKVEESRFEDRPPSSPDEDDEEEKKQEIARSSSSMTWGPRPTVRHQMQEQPNTVRFVNPETKILNLSNPEHLKEYNRIQSASSDLEAPTIGITEIEKQKHEGTWTVFITFCEVQYMQL